MRLRRHFVSLTSRLVVTAVVLVAVVSLMLGTATTFAMRSYLLGQLDGKVSSAATRASPVPDDAGNVPPPPGFDNTTDGDRSGFGIQGPGTLIADLDTEGRGAGEVLASRRGEANPQLSEAAIEVLATVPADGQVHAVDIPGDGTYRVAAVASTDGTLVTGLPTADVDSAVTSLIRVELLLALLGVGVAGFAGFTVVRHQLRPLREVAATAHNVALLPLESGAIGVTERVPAHLTDEATEVGQVGSALNTLLAHVETSLDARHQSELRVRQFVADASHELRTPLTTIAGYTELARRRPDDAATSATALAKVEEESRRMTALVEDLLLLARLDSGRPLERTPVDMTRLLLEAVSDARVLGPDHHWRLDLPDEAVEVTGDEQRLHQVVTNLLTNARKYTPPGTTVTVTATPDGFRVHDDGPGFPQALVDGDATRAFERFARGDAARHREGGVGLGLALVEAIVTAHGGRVTLRSVPGDTTVTVRLGTTEIV